MRRDYVGLASIFLRLAMAPDAMFGNSHIRRQDEAGRNLIKSFTGRILRRDDLLFLAEEGSIRIYMLAGATQFRAYEGKKVRISVSFRQACMNSAEAVGIVGCPLQGGRRMADENQDSICFRQSIRASAAPFRPLA
jgi:hypothetical protein